VFVSGRGLQAEFRSARKLGNFSFGGLSSERRHGRPRTVPTADGVSGSCGYQYTFSPVAPRAVSFEID
jgi:hypothetical protein